MMNRHSVTLLRILKRYWQIWVARSGNFMYFYHTDVVNEIYQCLCTRRVKRKTVLTLVPSRCRPLRTSRRLWKMSPPADKSRENKETNKWIDGSVNAVSKKLHTELQILSLFVSLSHTQTQTHTHAHTHTNTHTNTQFHTKRNPEHETLPPVFWV